MYLKGLADTDYSIFTGEAPTDAPNPVPDTVYVPQSYGGAVATSKQAPTDNADWTKVVSTALATWGNFAVAKTQADANVKTAPYGLYSRYTPFGTPIGTNPLQPINASPISGTMLILAAVAIGAYLLLKKD